MEADIGEGDSSAEPTPEAADPAPDPKCSETTGELGAPDVVSWKGLPKPEEIGERGEGPAADPSNFPTFPPSGVLSNFLPSGVLSVLD